MRPNSIRSINRPYSVHVSLEQQCCYSLLHLLKHYPDRNTDARAALFWQSNSHVTWQKRFNELQHTQRLAGRDVPNWHTSHTFAPETTSCPSIEVNWKLIRERLKRGGDTLCICPSFDASKVVLIFTWCTKTHGCMTKVCACDCHPDDPVKLQTNMSWCRNGLYLNVMFSVWLF